ncbi:MAG TPA: hypothetical protein VJV74_16850 [Terriglobia bacterium]|nr:hypothetical protein [Terriglobia bacterium]
MRWVAVALVLLAALAWALNPRQSKFTPAPLGSRPAVCPRLPREFVPSDVTELREPPFPALSRERRLRVLARMNAEECPCGCKLSVAACRANNPTCKTSAERAGQIVDSTPH